MLIGGLLEVIVHRPGWSAVDVELRCLDFIRRICHFLLSFAFIPDRVVVPTSCLPKVPLQE